MCEQLGRSERHGLLGEERIRPGEGVRLPLQPRRLLERTLGVVGSLALKLGMARKVLLTLGGIAALVLVCLVLLTWTLVSG